MIVCTYVGIIVWHSDVSPYLGWLADSVKMKRL